MRPKLAAEYYFPFDPFDFIYAHYSSNATVIANSVPEYVL